MKNTYKAVIANTLNNFQKLLQLFNFTFCFRISHDKSLKAFIIVSDVLSALIHIQLFKIYFGFVLMCYT